MITMAEQLFLLFLSGLAGVHGLRVALIGWEEWPDRVFLGTGGICSLSFFGGYLCWLWFHNVDAVMSGSGLLMLMTCWAIFPALREGWRDVLELFWSRDYLGALLFLFSLLLPLCGLAGAVSVIVTLQRIMQ
ncbi:MAG: hypothetical protein ACPLRH_07505 [Desulfotomaculales bacterium]